MVHFLCLVVYSGIQDSGDPDSSEQYNYTSMQCKIAKTIKANSPTKNSALKKHPSSRLIIYAANCNLEVKKTSIK